MPQDAIASVSSLNDAERLIAGLFHALATLLLVFILRAFLTVYIIAMYMQLNVYAKKMPSVPQDLSMLMRWKCQQWQRHGAPPNHRIDQVIDQVGLNTMCG